MAGGVHRQRMWRLGVAAAIVLAGSLHSRGTVEAANACAAKTVSAYARMPNGTLNYARVTIAMSVCWNTSTNVLTSATCTYGSAVLRPATYAVAGTLVRKTTGGVGTRYISCDSYRRFRLDRPAPSPDLYATPRVILVFAEGRFARVQAWHDVFDS